MERTIELSDTKARQGVMLGPVRYVLAISIALAVIGMIVVATAA
jgi:hypothetical protein